MLGQLTVYTPNGNYTVTVNGGVASIRQAEQKLHEAKRVEGELWNKLYSHFWAIQEIIEQHTK